jgi:hypothetical protein
MEIPQKPKNGTSGLRGVVGGRGQGAEMAQTMYAHMNQ